MGKEVGLLRFLKSLEVLPVALAPKGWYEARANADHVRHKFKNNIASPSKLS